MSEALWRWSAHQLAAAVRSGAVSAREAVVASLDRVQAVNPALNAVVDVLADEALAAAQAADDARRRGDVLGPLHGVPVTPSSRAAGWRCRKSSAIASSTPGSVSKSSGTVIDLPCYRSASMPVELACAASLPSGL